MILLRQQAAREGIDERKIVSMVDRQPVNPNKPILGGRNIVETDEQMIQRFKNQNKEAVERLKIKKDPPEELADGGVAGLLGERPGYASGLSVEEQLNELRRQKGVDEDPLTSTKPISSIPDLNNPDVLNQIAIDTGMPTVKEGIYGIRKDVATPGTASTIKNIQDFKRGTDRYTAPEISDFMGVDGIYKGLNPKEVQSIYDKVEI